jgi:hypothetical protein
MSIFGDFFGDVLDLIGASDSDIKQAESNDQSVRESSNPWSDDEYNSIIDDD